MKMATMDILTVLMILAFLLIFDLIGYKIHSKWFYGLSLLLGIYFLGYAAVNYQVIQVENLTQSIEPFLLVIVMTELASFALLIKSL